MKFIHNEFHSISTVFLQFFLWSTSVNFEPTLNSKGTQWPLVVGQYRISFFIHFNSNQKERQLWSDKRELPYSSSTMRPLRMSRPLEDGIGFGGI